MKKFMLLAVSLAFLSSPAFAAKTPVARHCVGKNGKEITATSAKACKAASWKWVRMKTPKTPKTQMGCQPDGSGCRQVFHCAASAFRRNPTDP